MHIHKYISTHICTYVYNYVNTCVCMYVCVYIKVSSNCPKGDIQAEYMLIDKNSDHEADKQVCSLVSLLALCIMRFYL